MQNENVNHLRSGPPPAVEFNVIAFTSTFVVATGKGAGDCGILDWIGRPHTLQMMGLSKLTILLSLQRQTLFVGVLAVGSSSIVVVPIIDNGVDGFLGGVHVGVLNSGADVIFSKKLSNCLSDNALCNVSNGRMGGTPPKPSRTVNEKTFQMNSDFKNYT